VVGLSISHGVLFLAIAGLLVPVCRRFSISPIICFLLSGVFLGPSGIRQWFAEQSWAGYVFVSDVNAVRDIAELGVVLLMFMIGLEVSLPKLVSMRRQVFGMGVLQILLSGTMIATIAYGFGNSVQASVLLGASLALSSSALVLQLLIERKQFGTNGGQATFAVLLAQDLAVIPILLLVSAFSTTDEGLFWLELLKSLAKAVLTIGMILLVGRLLIKSLVSKIVASGSAETSTAIAFLIIAITAGLTHLAGLSSVLGAFLAGLILSESEYRNEIELYVEPFKGLLLGLFFLSVGLVIDLSAIYHQLGTVIAAVVGLLLIKAILMWLIARLFGYNSKESAKIGVMLSQGGEFALVVITLSISLELLGHDVGQFMLLVTALSMLVYPFIAITLLPTFEGLPAVSGETENNHSKHVIVVGIGRVGRIVIDTLEQEHVPWVAIDRNVEKFNSYPAELCVQGDARRSATLERASSQNAALLLLCIDDHDSVEDIISVARRLSDDTPIVARSKDESHSVDLLRQGADSVIPEAREAGLQIAETALVGLGFPAPAASDLIATRRAWLENELSDIT